MIALGAGETVIGMVREDQFRNGLPRADNASGIGIYDHSFRNGSGTGRGQIAATLNLDHAYTAGSG